jgi:RNA polymerase sigma-70 factor, ECF subfamily
MAGTARQRMSQELAARFEREALPHRMMLLRSALRLTRHAHDAEDLVQETMAKACASFHSYQPGTNARAWLHRIMLNIFLSSYRKTQREPFLELSPTGPLPPDAAHRSQLPSAEEHVLTRLSWLEIEAALRSVPASFRQAVYLVDVQGYSYKEAASQMGTPVGTALSRVHRGRAALRSRLSQAAPASGQREAAA